MPERRFRPLWLLLALAVPALTAGGCKDGRGDPTAPDTGALSGGVIFGSALVSTMFFDFQNQLASGLLAIHESGVVPLPFRIRSCTGDSTAIVSDNNDSDPSSYRVTFGSGAGLPFVINCGTEVPLAFNGVMVFRFLETSPGLEYLIQMEFEHATGTPRGVTMQLPQGFGGGAILSITTPYDDDPTDAYPQGCVRYRLDTDRVNLNTGTGHMLASGTLRLEDRGLPITLVEELNLSYVVRHSAQIPGVVVFDPWPGGMYEVASGVPTGPGAPPAPGYPVELYFDGLGKVSYSFEGHDCEGNLLTGDNPCDQF